MSPVPYVVLDPGSERVPAERRAAPRLESLAGRTIGLLDISKPRGDRFLDQLQRRLEEKQAHVLRFRKPTFAKNAPLDLRRKIESQCDAVLEALAD
jgi:hypothetical protein